MSKRVSCKFFAQGSCTKGMHCKFGHDRNYQTDSKPICFYYQRGSCNYGSQCRYEHVNIPHQPISTPSNFQAHLASSSSQIPHNPIGSSINGEKATSSRPRYLTNKSSCLQNHNDHTCLETLAKQPLCNSATTGDCPHGEKCLHIHGDLCSTCKKHCLHPYRPNESEEHIKVCQHNKQMEILKLSEEIECCVCLERVLSKATADERKFGLLSECDHSFCISCIRNWRNNSPDSGMDVNTALRACPVCRKISYFVVPSTSWYSTKEEKQAIISTYKNRLKSIDCKHFDFGSGSCPFRNKCFYRHLYKPGRSRPRPQSNRPRDRYFPSSDFVDELDLMLADSLRLDDFDFDFDDFTSLQRYLDFGEEDYEDSSRLEMAGMITRLMMELSVGGVGIGESEDEDEGDESDEDEGDESDGADGE